MSTRLLLDTHAFLWLASGDSRVSKKALELAGNSANSLWFSVASIWEIAIKTSLGKLELGAGVEEIVESQTKAMSLKILDVQTHHAAAVAKLPFHHRDPFDRLLVAQARSENLQLLSRDVIFDEYFDHRIW